MSNGSFVGLFAEAMDKTNVLEENRKNSSESLQKNKIDKKVDLEINGATITELESPSVDTSKGISTSTSGDSISVSVSVSETCNGHESPVKEETLPVEPAETKAAAKSERGVICDENSMDQEREGNPLKASSDGVIGPLPSMDSDEQLEKGDGDGLTANSGKVIKTTTLY